jgi:predicted RecB family nuclease
MFLMLTIDGGIELSATDLVGYLNCRYLTDLDLAVANGRLAKPKHWDPMQDLLRERGAIHEDNFIDHLKSRGKEVFSVQGVGLDSVAVNQTASAMRSGAQIIYQGAFRSAGWGGRTDVLRRINVPSELGGWSYEVIDTKLSRETKGGTVLQLSLYSDLVASVQGCMPELMYVVVPWSDYEPQSFRTSDFAAYYRKVKYALNRRLQGQPDQNIYPDPKEHCEICRWRTPCDARRRADDHLCLVAGISKVQINELKRHGINTATGLAKAPLPLPWEPERGATTSYERIREQARIQLAGRVAGQAIYEALPSVEGFGLSSLPPPSAGDIFFDLEGDPFVGEHGMEYLFGYVFSDQSESPQYIGEWAFSREREKLIFENFIDFVIARWQAFPDFHIYHYAPYEPAALKRLMGRYGTRGDEIDRMLRAHLFVDLYSVVKNGIRASVESYSIKKLEPLYKYERVTELSEANKALANVQAALELGDLGSILENYKDAVESYNRDDCLSTLGLRDWLERVRSELVESGEVIDRPVRDMSAPSEALSEWQITINSLVSRITVGVPAEMQARTEEQQARWILANILDWHRREEKALWWEYFRLRDLSSEELLDERAGLSGLEFVANVGGTTKAPIHRYRFPPQETELRGDEDLHTVGGNKLGTAHDVSLDNRTIDIKKRVDSAEVHPEAVFAHKVIDTKVIATALLRLGEYVADHGVTGDGQYQAGRDLLLRLAPRIGSDPIRRLGETALESALRIAPELTSGVLPVQGPPGSGKTFTGARMICELVGTGKRVGITANSHKVVHNLLEETVRAADERGVKLQCIEKVGDTEPDQDRIRFTTINADVFSAIATTCHVAAGTAWLWSRAEAFDTLDVLVVDEAAQMSLANVLAISQAANSVILLGDPQQLDQPSKGSHPDGVDVSALDHILGEHQTIGPDKGLFLEQTWRLHPDICRFTSELFYEGRLESRAGLEVQAVKSSAGCITGTGLRFLPVEHAGNQNSAPEEAECVRDLVNDILGDGTTWVDRNGVEQPLTLEDILIVAPYNAQVHEIQDRLPGARVGTVDKFQGQEAPIAIYSMTTSTYADAPRGMEFLYSLNRLNVATSRAKCVCIIVASPALFEADCRTPRQMHLANAFCRYLELTQTIQLER